MRQYKNIERINGKRVLIYDAGPNFHDRYTAVYLDESEYKPGTFSGRGMSENPFSPQGFGCSCVVEPGRHLGKRIKFEDCPPEVQRCIQQDTKTEEETAS